MAITRYRSTGDLFHPFFDDAMSPLGTFVRAPETDVIERENEIRVVSELPGLRVEDIDISLENNVLTINGEKREEREEGGEKDTYHLTERRWGRFSRSFILPREVEQDRIQAHFDDGVLTISIPKNEKARRRRIDIRHEGGRQAAETTASKGAR